MEHCHSDCCHTPPLSARLCAWGEVLTLLTMAAFLGFSYYSGWVRQFVAGQYVWLSAAAAGVLVAMAAARWHTHRHARGGCDCADHASGKIPLSACMIAIVASIALALAVHPQRYSPEGVYKRREAVQMRDPQLRAAMGWILGRPKPQAEAAQKKLVLPKTPTVAELIRIAASEDREAMEGQFVQVIGQCILPDGPQGKRFEIYRLLVTCCVADSTAVAMPIARDTSEALDAGGWISVGGVLKFDDPDDPTMPVLHAATLTKIAEPATPFL